MLTVLTAQMCRITHQSETNDPVTAISDLKKSMKKSKLLHLQSTKCGCFDSKASFFFLFAKAFVIYPYIKTGAIWRNIQRSELQVSKE